jgi:hypothetical protein
MIRFIWATIEATAEVTFQLDACLRVGFECPHLLETHEDLPPIVFSKQRVLVKL